ncbi:hypothetical protein K443DRAFT_113958 [Laccaria amethystina LaAM-08-1]|uniref:Uncharacterized protein n=1 Tax=Laccaria amethystina LaAM-08-1 TaxID=1095629 RepID=A0A0C9WUI4_9AGAR|nr:hypothetical protein K443DRAFT_113958 [Laccaria amethystina LaAM-08-1]
MFTHHLACAHQMMFTCPSPRQFGSISIANAVDTTIIFAPRSDSHHQLCCHP